MKTMLITNRPAIAADAIAAGVTRIMVDLETLGKQERQASRNTFITTHEKEDIALIRKAIGHSELIVRINPWHDGSVAETEHAIAHGADLIMLPMITQMAQLETFIDTLAGRAKPLPLVETAYSMEHTGDIAAMPEIGELYIGLNDLHLSLGMDFLFEPLALGQLDQMAQQIRTAGKAFGFGGITAMGSGELPAQFVLGEHARLGSTRVILSSRFCKDIRIEDAPGRQQRIAQALGEMQNHYRRLLARSKEQQTQDMEEIFSIIKVLAQAARERRSQAQ